MFYLVIASITQDIFLGMRIWEWLERMKMYKGETGIMVGCFSWNCNHLVFCTMSFLQNLLDAMTPSRGRANLVTKVVSENNIGREHETSSLQRMLSCVWGPVDYSPPGQARMLGWVAIPFCREPCPPGDQACVSCIYSIGRWILYQQCHLGSPFYCCFSVSHSVTSLCNPTDCSMSGFPVLHYVLEFVKLMSTDSLMPPNRLILCHPSCPPALQLAQQQGLFQWVGSSKYWSFSCSISPSNEYSGLISFRIDWLDLLYVQGTLKSLHHITIQKHQFFSAQPSLRPTLTSVHDYWKTIAFTTWTFPIIYKKAFQCNIQKSKFSRMYYGILINVININYFVSIQIDVIMLYQNQLSCPCLPSSLTACYLSNRARGEME